MQGWSQREIAAALHISQAAVSKMLRRTGDGLAAEQQDARARVRARLAARYEYMYREAVKGYERSQAERTRRKKRQVTTADGTPGHTTLEADSVARDGDPRFLEQAGRALEREAQHHGLARGDADPQRDVDGDPEEARRRLACRLARLASTKSA